MGRHENGVGDATRAREHAMVDGGRGGVAPCRDGRSRDAPRQGGRSSCVHGLLRLRLRARDGRDLHRDDVVPRRDDLLDRMARRGRRGDDRRRGHGRHGRGDLRSAGEQDRLHDRNERAGVAAAAQPLASARLLRRRLDEAVGERAARAEEQRLDGGLRQVELVRDLLVRQALPLTEEQGAALLLRHRLERLGQADQLVGVGLVRGDVVLHRLEVARRLDAAPPRR